jgi:hypothetical protein
MINSPIFISCCNSCFRCLKSYSISVNPSNYYFLLLSKSKARERPAHKFKIYRIWGYHSGGYEESYLWDIMPYSPPKINWHFGRIFCLHLQGWRVIQVRYQLTEFIAWSVLVSCLACSSTLRMEAKNFSDTSFGFQRITWSYIQNKVAISPSLLKNIVWIVIV